jgi:hypothetical protein
MAVATISWQRQYRLDESKLPVGNGERVVQTHEKNIEELEARLNELQ